jgi:hypothetical protein
MSLAICSIPVNGYAEEVVFSIASSINENGEITDTIVDSVTFDAYGEAEAQSISFDFEELTFHSTYQPAPEYGADESSVVSTSESFLVSDASELLR